MHDDKAGDRKRDNGPVSCYVPVQSMAAMSVCDSVFWKMQYGAKSVAIK